MDISIIKRSTDQVVDIDLTVAAKQKIELFSIK